MSNTSFIAPVTLDQALDELAAPDKPAVLAGGTDLWPQWTSSVEPRPAKVLSLHRLEGLRQLTSQGGWLRIGAACTHTQLVNSREVREFSPALAAAAATIGAIQIQNQGTIGGNLANASPAADLPPPLVAAGARLELASRCGTREVDLDRFFEGYRKIDLRADELIIAVRVPKLPPLGREHFRKVGTRRAQAISKVVGSCRLVLSAKGVFTAAGIAFGSVGPTVIRCTDLEQWLIGRRPDLETAEEAERMTRETLRPIDDLRSSADYRKHVAGRLVFRWVQDQPDPAAP